MPSRHHSTTTIDGPALLATGVHHPGVGRNGRPFGARRLPIAFHTVVDPIQHPPQPWRDLPPPTGVPPFRMGLDRILAPEAIHRIVTSKQMVFHAVGDTGGVNTPTPIENVAAYMEKDFDGADPSRHPSFFYHLGDVVYYEGELANYFPEFYEPYITYPAPIVAVPGNHDGDVDPRTGETSLEGFMRNFCAQTPVHTLEARDAPRQAMTQPNVYWTLETPLATMIGLYSNCPEGGALSDAQIQWFESELTAAPSDRALVVAVHHPIYSAYGAKPGSQHLKSVLEHACDLAGRAPHLVLSGHVHNYQRFTATLAGKATPFIVAGAGGYNAKLHTLANIFHTSKLPIRMTGSDGTLEAFCDDRHGYLRVTVTYAQITCEYVAVPDPTQPTKVPVKPFDTLHVAIR